MYFKLCIFTFVADDLRVIRCRASACVVMTNPWLLHKWSLKGLHMKLGVTQLHVVLISKWYISYLWNIYKQFITLAHKYWGQMLNIAPTPIKWPCPDSKVHGANMGPTWVLSAPDGPHVGPMNLAIRLNYRSTIYQCYTTTKHNKV